MKKDGKGINIRERFYKRKVKRTETIKGEGVKWKTEVGGKTEMQEYGGNKSVLAEEGNECEICGEERELDHLMNVR